jgi:hypothetical protein
MPESLFSVKTPQISPTALGELLDSAELTEAVSEMCACGSARELSLGIDGFVCADARCPFRIAARIHGIAKRFSADDLIPLADLERICQESGYLTWLDFWADEWEDGSDIEDAREQLTGAIKREFDTTLAAVLSGFDVISRELLYSLCGDFETVSDLADAVDAEGVALVAERLQLTEAHLLPAAIHIFNRLTACIGEMLDVDDVFR